MQNTDKQRIIHLIGVPDIEGDQVHRIVHRKNALIWGQCKNLRGKFINCYLCLQIHSLWS